MIVGAKPPTELAGSAIGLLQGRIRCTVAPAEVLRSNTHGCGSRAPVHVRLSKSDTAWSFTQLAAKLIATSDPVKSLE